ncbi:UbiA family prenyltransferase [Paracidovorax anthurii]|uniref:4-hydroxybenzoate polyprenyltransferase n=1 Tax=Paracidovorax anthurii TaxID=78229 RepID=A0A328YKB4_9BURK|nr:UbiA family prenyltransferase [Paracidovorax anthurii]RAR73960.1 4-hydroxybenzoate polyprenyltransferase [Paracidovorax anthurii]
MLSPFDTPPPAPASSEQDVPLVVDLDGTLILTDMLHESSLQLARTAPWQVLALPLWLARGKAVLKRQVAERVRMDAATLPYHPPLVAWLREQKARGRRIVLCTASDQALADAVARHLGCFDLVMASDGARNLAGTAKAEALVERFGERGFDYAGNSRADLPVWRRARAAIVVNAPGAVERQARAHGNVERSFPAPPAGLSAWRKALRLHQWLKNLLLFVPLLAAHRLADGAAWAQLLPAFLAFGLCASSVYLANDLLDLESDRQHPRKRLRPFASGTLAAWKGVALVPLLATASLALAWLAGPAFLGWLAAYFAITWAYSLVLKRWALVDCITLAVLYSLRLVAGAAAVAQPLSFWLLAFSGFLFLSLAFVKRYAELLVQQAAGKTQAHGRGYLTSDAPVVQSLGVAAGYTAVVVLALYLNSDTVLLMYRSPGLIWVTVPVMAFWVSWMWLCAARGKMHDDPLVFAFKDRASIAASAVFGLALARMEHPW